MLYLKISVFMLMLFLLSAVVAQLQNNAYSTTCESDVSGIVLLDLENIREVDVIFVIECWQDTYHITVPAGRQLAYPAMLYEEEGPRGNLCMFNSHVEGEVDKILVTLVESPQVFFFSVIFCDKRKLPPRRILPYVTDCKPDSFDLVDFIFVNPDDVAMLVVINCWYGNEEILVSPGGNYTLTAEYYMGDYRAYRGCVFNPWTADDTQLLYFEKISNDEVYPFRVYCKKDLHLNPPSVAVFVTCPDDGSDVVKLHLENKDSDYTKFMIDCSNKWKTISLPKQGSVVVEGSFERSPSESCPSDVCCFNKVESVFGKHEYVKILSQNKKDGGHTWDVVFCVKSWRTGLPNGRYSTDCVPDQSGFVPIRVENTGDERLTFTLVCQQHRMEAHVGPHSVATFTAQYFSEAGNIDSTCMFTPGPQERVQSLKLFVSKSLNVFHDVNIYCSKRRTPPALLMPYQTDCSTNPDGHITVTLKNDRTVPVVYIVTCWFESTQVRVQAQSTKDLNVFPFNGENRDYGSACVMNPWIDSIQYLTIQTFGERNEDEHIVYCKTKPADVPPRVTFYSNCLPDTRGEIGLRINNNDKELLTISMSCENGAKSFNMNPGSSATIKGYLFKENVFYPQDSCVLTSWDEWFKGKYQFTWLLAEKITGYFSSGLIVCDNTPSSLHMDGQYHSNCRVDENKIVPLSLVNQGNDPLTIRLLCLEDIREVMVLPRSSVIYPAMFQENAFKTNHRHVCVFSKPSRHNAGISIFFEQTGNVFYRGDLYCDTSSKVTKPAIFYSTTCVADKSGYVKIEIINDSDQMLWYTIMCWKNLDTFVIDNHETKTVKAKFYHGGLDKDTCHFIPVFEDGTQYLYLKSQTLDGEALNNVIYCKTSPSKDPPELFVNTDCTGCTNSGVLPISVENYDNEIVSWTLFCKGQQISGYLKPQSNVDLSAALYVDEYHEYPDVDCIFWPFDAGYGNITKQYSWLLASRSDGNYTVKYVFCTLSEAQNVTTETTITNVNHLGPFDVEYSVEATAPMSTTDFNLPPKVKTPAQTEGGTQVRTGSEPAVRKEKGAPVRTDGVASGRTETASTGRTETAANGRTETVSTGRKKTASTGRIEIAPNEKTETAPNGRTETAPNGRTETVPNGRTETAPNGRTETAPNGRTETAPNGRTETAPNGRTETAPNGRTETAPNGRTETAPNGRTETAPNGRTETAPNGRTETAPNGRTETAPNGRTETASNGRTETASNGRTETASNGRTETASNGRTETGDTGRTETGDSGRTETGDSGRTETGDSGRTETGDSGRTETGDSGRTETGDSGRTEAGDSGRTEAGDSGRTEAGDSGRTEAGDSGRTEAGDSGRTEAGDSGRTEAGDSGRTEAGDSGRTEAGDSGRTEAGDSGRTEAGDSGRTEAGDSGRKESSPSQPKSSGTKARPESSSESSETASKSESQGESIGSPTRSGSGQIKKPSEVSGGSPRPESNKDPSRSGSSRSQTEAKSWMPSIAESETPSRAEGGTPSQTEIERTNQNEPAVASSSEIPHADGTSSRQASVGAQTMDNADKPIVALFPHCPDQISGRPVLELRSDVPAYALAKCRNGGQQFTPASSVSYKLEGKFKETDIGHQCLFYKKEGSTTFTVQVEVGWGEKNRELILYQKLFVVSCAYDGHGSADSETEVISDWYLAPAVDQYHLGEHYPIAFDLHILDALGRKIISSQISIGKKIRLKAVDRTGNIPAFRALNCWATNEVTSYPILRAGCGDGLILKRFTGFQTQGSFVYSPYFDAFKLRGDNSIRFECTFTACSAESCDGDSCVTVPRNKRSTKDGDHLPSSSNKFRLT